MNGFEEELQRLQPCVQEIAADHGVVPAVHHMDFIMQFLLNNPVFATKQDAVRYYFEDGSRSARRLAEILRDVCQPEAAHPTLLEFAAGYGCVTRHLKHALPDARITSSDIHSAAVSFIRSELGIETILSDVTPERFGTPERYDIVFALSFFSHMPRRTWGRWLASLSELTKPGGHLVFTTHGIQSRVHLGNPEIPEDGFWFRSESEQRDLSTEDYGLTLSTPNFVFGTVQRQLASARIVYYREAHWWSHQDLYVVHREHS